jgi:hypothetical protein
MPRTASKTTAKKSVKSKTGKRMGRPPGVKNKPKSSDTNSGLSMALTAPFVSLSSAASVSSTAQWVPENGLQGLLFQTQQTLEQVTSRMAVLETQLVELDHLRSQYQQLETIKSSIETLLQATPKTATPSVNTAKALGAKPSKKEASAPVQPTATGLSFSPLHFQPGQSLPNPGNKRPYNRKTTAAAATALDGTAKRGPGRPKGSGLPKNPEKGNYIFIPELAFEQSKTAIKRRESVNFELYKAIVLNGGVANSEQIKQHLVDNDIRQPNKDNASFEDVSLTDISSRISYLITKGAVKTRGRGVFASAFGWQKGEATGHSSANTEERDLALV